MILKRRIADVLLVLLNRSLTLFVLIMLLATYASAQETSHIEESDIHLLKYPYPYCAAFTICSDTHNKPVEQFEAVHKLINSNEVIERNTNMWLLLFNDPKIDEYPAWENSIQGFGFPFGDTIFLYNEYLGIYARFNEETGEPEPHYYNGRDFRDIVDEWIRCGWVNSLHTPGSGYIPREATAAGLTWFEEYPHRRLAVWVNHSLASTPACIEPDVPEFLWIPKNILKIGTAAMCWLGMESFVLKFVAAPNPAPFPLGQRGICWLLSILLVSSIIWLFISLVVRRIRRLVSFVIGGLILTGVLIVLIVMPLHYAQGDNPDSPLYCADLVRQAGFRYFWNQRPWNEIDIEGNLILQERSISGGRPSILDIAKLDDGLQCMTFGRNHKGRGGSKSMQMLTQENLEDLCEKEGTCIIYIHWVELPKQIFTAEALLNLERLKSLNETGQIWLASTYDILHFTFIRAFLEYQVQRQNGGYILNIVQVNDPINEAFIPSLVDLQGISFECPLGDKIEIRLAGKSLGRDAFDVIKDKGQQIIRFRLQSN